MPTLRTLCITSKLAACLLLAVSSAHSATIRGNDNACQALAGSFDNIALYRELGLSWADAKPQLERAIQDSMADKEAGIVKDADDAAYVMSIGWSVWNGAYALLQPGVLGQAIYHECMGKVKARQARLMV